MTTKSHWLVAGQVITANRTGTEHTKKLNVLLTTQELEITRIDLAKAQEGLQHRFVSECPQIPGFKINDVYIEGIVLLGTMTPEQFNEGYNKEIAAAGGVN